MLAGAFTALRLSSQAYTLVALFLFGGALAQLMVAGFDRLALLQGEDPPVRMNRRRRPRSLRCGGRGQSQTGDR
ncbi:MAG: hypothetical protein KC613_27140 [Myxococcales bacterium]|nr:hypothetical protein [Myxococcales bacterium]